jgi:hypothetical protein
VSGKAGYDVGRDAGVRPAIAAHKQIEPPALGHADRFPDPAALLVVRALGQNLPFDTSLWFFPERSLALLVGAAIPEPRLGRCALRCKSFTVNRTGGRSKYFSCPYSPRDAVGRQAPILIRSAKPANMTSARVEPIIPRAIRMPLRLSPKDRRSSLVNRQLRLFFSAQTYRGRAPAASLSCESGDLRGPCE